MSQPAKSFSIWDTKMITYIGINGRNDIPRFLNEEGLTGLGVEIGTHLGEYANLILNTWRGTLYCIDPWQDAPDYEAQIPLLWGGSDRAEHKRKAEERFRPYIARDRCRIMALTSQDAVQFFQNNSLDFVYVDGNHQMEHVLNDLQWWWPKLRSGGYMFGHDFVCPGETYGWAGHIQPAVTTFCMNYGVDYSLIPEGNLPWSFAIRKP